MRVDDFLDGSHGYLEGSRWFRRELMTQLCSGPLAAHSDIEVAVPLARLVHDELQRYGTDGGQGLD